LDSRFKKLIKVSLKVL